MKFLLLALAFHFGCTHQRVSSPPAKISRTPTLPKTDSRDKQVENFAPIKEVVSAPEVPKVALVFDDVGPYSAVYLGAMRIWEQNGLPVDEVYGIGSGSPFATLYAFYKKASRLEWDYFKAPALRPQRGHNLTSKWKQLAPFFEKTIPDKAMSKVGLPLGLFTGTEFLIQDPSYLRALKSAYLVPTKVPDRNAYLIESIQKVSSADIIFWFTVNSSLAKRAEDGFGNVIVLQPKMKNFNLSGLIKSGMTQTKRQIKMVRKLIEERQESSPL